MAAMRCSSRRAMGLAIAALLIGGAGQCPAMQTGEYPAPEMEGFILSAEEDGDGDGDGIKETHIRHFRNLAGDSVFSMTTKDTLWAWSMSSHGGGATDEKHNYVIRDSNCDGTFDERYGLDEEFHVPECLKDSPHSAPSP